VQTRLICLSKWKISSFLGIPRYVLASFGISSLSSLIIIIIIIIIIAITVLMDTVSAAAVAAGYALVVLMDLVQMRELMHYRRYI